MQLSQGSLGRQRQVKALVDKKLPYQRSTPVAEECGCRIPVGSCAAGWDPVCSTNAWACQTEPMKNPEEARDSPPLVTKVPSTRGTDAPSSRETSTQSLATSETTHFSLVTKVSGSLATESSPAVETKAPSSLATEGPSMATKSQSFLIEVPSVSSMHTQPSLDEGPLNFLTSTHIPVPESTNKEASKSSPTSMSPEKSLYPKMSLTETGESVPLAQEEAETEAELLEAEAELPVSSEALVPVPPAQDRGGLQASLDHSGHPASTSLPNLPSALANGTGGRTLALQSSWTGAEDPEKAGLDLKNSGHVWSPLLGLLLPPLLMAGLF